MASMYEKIMSTPLFMGLSHQQISTFLEKTPITFSQFEKNEVICKEGDSTAYYSCMIEGALEIEHRIGKHKNLIILETIEKPYTINADRMFGIYTKSPVEIRAKRKTSIMRFNKEQFLKILKSDNIIMLNYLNQICLKGQMSYPSLDCYPSYRLINFISQALNVYTSKLSNEVEFKFEFKNLADFLNITETELNEDIQLLNNKGILILTSDGFIIKDRNSIL